MSLGSLGGIAGAVCHLPGDPSSWARTATGGCASWQDVSQQQVGAYRYWNYNHASWSGAAANQPAINLGGLGGMPALDFSGGSAKLLTQLAQNPVGAGADRHVFIVCRATNAAGGGLLSFRTSGHQYHLQLAAVGGTTYAASEAVAISFTSPPTLLNTNYVAEYIIGPSRAFKVKLNGVLQTLSASTLSIDDDGGTGFSIGNRPDASLPFLGLIRQVLIVAGTLPDDQALVVRKVLAADAGITVV